MMYGKIKRFADDSSYVVHPHLFKLSNHWSGTRFYMSIGDLNDVYNIPSSAVRFYSGNFRELFFLTRLAAEEMSYSPMVSNANYVMFIEEVVIE